MACYAPLTAWQSPRTDLKKKPLHFSFVEGYKEIQIPCGRCIGCRLAKASKWAARCMMESSLYEKNCFVTLTYDDEHMPENASLVKKDLQKFFKRLRRKYGEKIRFYACGEYGDYSKRPHYHMCIFNHDFEDKQRYSVRQGCPLYVSDSLQKLWPYGYSTIGEVTFESAAYVARYCTKKIYGKDAEKHYGKRIPEFTNMSRRPGIGKKWFDNFKDDIYNYDTMIVRPNKIQKPPRYFDNMLEVEEPERLLSIKERRKTDVKQYRFQELLKQEKTKEYQFKQKEKERTI